MTHDTNHWQRFRELLLYDAELGCALDISRMNIPADFFQKAAALHERAHAAMRELEGGAIANPDEKRMVGHYWLRAPELSPSAEITAAIKRNKLEIEKFASNVLSGATRSPHGAEFRSCLLIGIGGS